MKLVGRIRSLAPQSIAGRLAFGSAILVILALIVTGISTGFVLSRFIRGQVDQRLDTQIGAVAAALSAQGRLPQGLSLGDAPPFDRPNDGWYWMATADGHRYRSKSLEGGDIVNQGSERWWDAWHRGPSGDDARPRPFKGAGPRGEPLYLRTQIVPMNGVWVTITASAPAHALVKPLRDAMVPIVLSMLALGLLLGGATVLQLRVGLRPLARMTKDLENVRAGRAESIGGYQPRELRGLVSELNSLIAQNAEGIKRARGHVSNLGHALNTPLAALALSFSNSGKAGDRDRFALVNEMQERIRHHLGRARAAALHGASHVSTSVGQHVQDLKDVLLKVHADRRLVVTTDIPETLAVACELQDLDEMLGNILDNAFKWARSAIAVTGRLQDQHVVLDIEDDGPGIASEKLDEVMKAGRRLDETIPGNGFGLSITRELAELYGGYLILGRSRSGGLKATVGLPASGTGVGL
jgi:signal transduction histidine kinase